MNEHLAVTRSIEADQVLQNEAFKLAMQTLKDDVLRTWKDCPVRDREGQLLLLQLAKLTDKFEAILIGLIEAGKFAKHKIDLDNLRSESKAQRFIRKVTG